MVGKLLTGNGITAYGKGAYSLIGGNELSDAGRDAYPVSEGHCLVVSRRHVAAGSTEAELLLDFPQLTHEDVLVCDPSAVSVRLLCAPSLPNDSRRSFTGKRRCHG
jgi:hypothetical protein